MRLFLTFSMETDIMGLKYGKLKIAASRVVSTDKMKKGIQFKILSQYKYRKSNLGGRKQNEQ